MRTTTSRWLVGVAAVAAATTTLAACGSSSKGSKTTPGSSSAPSSAAAATSPAPTGSLIKIGVIGSNSGSQASSCDQGETVGPAWADWVNANGGINGHQVQVIFVDDAGDPAKAQSAEKQLVDSDQVVAIVVACDNLVSAYAATRSPRAFRWCPASRTTRLVHQARMFVTPTDVASGLVAQMVVAKQYGHAKKFANLYCAEVAACAQAIASAEAGRRRRSASASPRWRSAPRPPRTPRSACSCSSRGVDYAQLNFTTSAAAKFVQDCQAQNYNPTWGSSEQAAGADL